MNPFSHTGLSISDSLKSVRKSVLIYEIIIHFDERIYHLTSMLLNNEIILYLNCPNQYFK